MFKAPDVEVEWHAGCDAMDRTISNKPQTSKKYLKRYFLCEHRISFTISVSASGYD
jgi:hypothetical protein